MNKAYLTVGIIILSVIALVIINVIVNFSTGNELDYYLLKETANAAMQDAIDVNFTQQDATVRIDKEQFAESFLLRFASTVDSRRAYNIKFYDISEIPPKVSIRVTSSDSSNSVKGQTVSVVNELTAIVETDYQKDPAATHYAKTQNKS